MMHIYHDLNTWRTTRRTLAPNISVGFVPTMGNLHQGHLSLIQASQRENDETVVSLFVNPTQFNDPNDFLKYPRTLEADLALLEAQHVNHCLVPTESQLYPEGYRYHVDEVQTSLCMEGEKRPGHFKGVLTVVMKLLNLVAPDRAYFGEKDHQQFQLIKGMVNDFFLNIEIKACPTVREQSGLALSSRNHRLTAAQRAVADQFAHIFHQNKACQQIIDELNALPLRVDYVTEHDGRRFAAVYLDEVRLIDNYALPTATETESCF